MEERIIDDEYGRGIRLKKTKDGYVDVTDELSESEADGAEEAGEEGTEEVSFEFPDLDEDDEDLVNLTPNRHSSSGRRRKKRSRHGKRNTTAFARKAKTY